MRKLAGRCQKVKQRRGNLAYAMEYVLHFVEKNEGAMRKNPQCLQKNLNALQKNLNALRILAYAETVSVGESKKKIGQWMKLQKRV